MKTVHDIRAAEEEYERIITSAKEKADKILRKAKENILEERGKMNQEMVTLKNDRIQKGAKEIEVAVHKIIDKAKDDADKMRTRKLDQTAVSKISKEFIGSL